MAEYDVNADAQRVIQVGPTGTPVGNVGGNLSLVQKPLQTAAVYQGTAGTGATLNIPAPGAGLSIYIQYIEVIAYATAAKTGGAAPTLVTTTGLPNNFTLPFPTAQAIGTVQEFKYEGSAAMQATVNMAVTIVCPATASTIWAVNVGYFIA